MPKGRRVRIKIEDAEPGDAQPRWQPPERKCDCGCGRRATHEHVGYDIAVSEKCVDPVNLSDAGWIRVDEG